MIKNSWRELNYLVLQLRKKIWFEEQIDRISLFLVFEIWTSSFNLCINTLLIFDVNGGGGYFSAVTLPPPHHGKILCTRLIHVARIISKEELEFLVKGVASPEYVKLLGDMIMEAGNFPRSLSLKGREGERGGAIHGRMGCHKRGRIHIRFF